MILYTVLSANIWQLSATDLTSNGQLDLDADDASQVEALFDFFIQEGLLCLAEANLYREDLFQSE